MFVELKCRDRFKEYVLHAEESKGSAHLVDHAYAWIAYGDGARECGNDYGVFLGALLLAQSDYQSAPSIYFPDGEARPTAFLDESCPECRLVFDPTFFAWMAVDPQRLNRAYDEEMAEEAARLEASPKES